MRRLHDLHLPSTGVDKWLLRCLAFHVLLVGVSQGRVVVRGLAVLSAEGLSISGEHQQTSAIPSSDGGGGGGATLGLGRRPSIVLDCVYDLVPSANIHNNGSRGAPLTAIDGVGGKYNDSHTNNNNNNNNNNNLSSSNDNEGRSSNNNNNSKSSSSSSNNNNNSSSNNNISNSTNNNNKDGASAILAGLSVDRRRRENERTPRVVKWFRNSEATPFYQWIPSSHSRLFHHAYRDLLDTLYKHSDRPADMFRAVRITRLVRELSGNFTCEVQDEELDDEVQGDADDSGIAEDASEQMATHELRIYDPPVEFEIHLNLAAEQLYCTAWTSEPPESIHMRLFRHDHDAWQMPLGPPVDLNATTTVRDLRTRTAVPASSPSPLWPGPLSLSAPPPSSSSSSSWSPTNAVSDALIEMPSVATTTVRGRPSSEEAPRQGPAPPPQPPPSSSSPSSSSSSPPPPPPTNRPSKANHKYQLVRIEASARLHAEDVKHLDVDTSRTFVCELIYERLRQQQQERSVLANDNATVSPYPAADDNDDDRQSTAVIRETAPVFQRSVKIVHESPSSAAAEGAADYGDRWDDEIGAPKPAETKGPPFWSAWITAVSRDVSISPSSSSSASASTSSARTGRSVSLRQATCTQEASLYERAYYRLAPAVGLPLLGLLYTYTL